VDADAPRSTREVGGIIDQRFGVSFSSHSGLIALLHRLGFAHRKSAVLSSRISAARPRPFQCWKRSEPSLG
jgi:hypothetical protein